MLGAEGRAGNSEFRAGAEPGMGAPAAGGWVSGCRVSGCRVSDAGGPGGPVVRLVRDAENDLWKGRAPVIFLNACDANLGRRDGGGGDIGCPV